MTLDHIIEARMMSIAKEMIKDFIETEYDKKINEFDLFDLNHISVAHTQTEDGEHDIDVEVDLSNFTINKFLDGELIITEKFLDLDDFLENGLKYLDFQDLVYIDEENISKDSEYEKLKLMEDEWELEM